MLKSPDVEAVAVSVYKIRRQTSIARQAVMMQDRRIEFDIAEYRRQRSVYARATT